MTRRPVRRCVRRPGAYAAFAAGALVMSIACNGGPREEHRAVLDLAREGRESGASGGASSSLLLGTSRTVPARVTTGVAPFAVLARQSRISKTPCAACHNKPLAQMRWTGSDGRATAHWQVELAHAPKSVMSCATCHAPDQLDRLRTLGGEPVAFDHAYDVCAQCHSKQKADWEGGAHGKRAGGWAPPRVVFNCTECHDPHRPALAPRWPARAGREDR